MSLTRLTFTYSGGPQVFSTNFALGVLEHEHIFVAVDGNVDGAGNQIYSNFVYDEATGNVTITDTLTDGDTGVISRVVPIDRLITDFEQGDDVTRRNLNRMAKQVIMVVQEVKDQSVQDNSRVDVLSADVLAATEAAELSATTATSAATSASTSAQEAADSATAAINAKEEAEVRLSMVPPQFDTVQQLLDNVELRLSMVPPQFDTVQQLLDNEATTLGPVGQIVEAEGYRYKNEASGVSGPDIITTEGGAKLRNLRNAEGTRTFTAYAAPLSAGQDATGAIRAALHSKDSHINCPHGTFEINDTIEIAGDTAETARSNFAMVATGPTIFRGGAGLVGKPMFRLTGSIPIQQINNLFEGFVLDLNGASHGMLFDGGAILQTCKRIRLRDTSKTPGAIGIQSHNSFNMTFRDMQSESSLLGTAILQSSNSADPGFPQNTNSSIRDSIFQCHGEAFAATGIAWDTKSGVAADTQIIDNVAFKHDAGVAVDVDGGILNLDIRGLHVEVTKTALKSSSGYIINADISSSIFTDVEEVFNWGSLGKVGWSASNRILNGTGNTVFAPMAGDIIAADVFGFASASYALGTLTGSLRNTSRQPIFNPAASVAVGLNSDNRLYSRNAGAMTLNLPALSAAKDGFRVNAARRGGDVNIVANGADIFALSGATASSITLTGFGSSVSLEASGGVWVVVAAYGNVAATP